jgi:LmeA-like phospholipid-binding
VGRARRIAAVSAGAIVLLLALAQLLLPGIAADRISSRLSRYGHVRSVHVSAWPAVELLWGNADKVSVRADNLTLALPQTGHVLREASGAEEIDMTVVQMRVGPLQLGDVRLEKHGDELAAHALATEAAVAQALPPGVSVRLLHSENGTVEVGVGGSLFGVGGEVDAVAAPREGKLIVRPTIPLLRLFSLTLYENPDVYIEGIGASPTLGGAPESGYELSMQARLQ